MNEDQRWRNLCARTSAALQLDARAKYDRYGSEGSEHDYKNARYFLFRSMGYNLIDAVNMAGGYD